VVVVVVIVVVVVVAVMALALVGFNKLQRARQGVREAWAQFDTLLQRRYDLVGALLAVVRAGAAQERRAQVAVGEARGVAGAGGVAERDRAERAVAAEAGQLVALAEANPSLQADQQFTALHAQLVRTEDDIAASRRYYNGRVRIHNTTIQSLPWNLLAGPLGFRAEDYFQVDLEEREAPRAA
jgi:LemA protein